MAIVFEEKESVFFVGGRGTKAGSSGAGGCTKEFWGDLKDPDKSLSDVMGTNGEPLSDAAAAGAGACDVLNNGSGGVRITKAGQGYFTDCSAGLIVYVIFTATYTNGRYEVTDVDTTSGDWIDISLAYSATTTCSAYVGGAFDKLQTASDNTDANTGSPHNVEILTNLNETFTLASDEIDVDVGGGDGSVGTWKRIIGVDDDGVELAEGSYVTIDGNSKSCRVFCVSEVENIEFRHIYAKEVANTYPGFYFTATSANHGFTLKDCKSTGCKYGVEINAIYCRMVHVMGGYYSSDTGPAIYVTAGRYLNVLNVELAGSLAGALIGGNVVGTLLVDGCVLRKTGNYAVGVYSDYTWAFLVIRNCVFYDIDDCIKIGEPNIRLIQYNNIFVLHSTGTGKIINRISGSVMYSDYSCAWAVGGAPAAPVRWGGTGLPEHSIEQDPQIVDAANGDFRPRNPNVLRGGKPDIADNSPQMGAVLQKYQFARRAKAANLGRLQIIR
jgi:hypothetical protein